MTARRKKTTRKKTPARKKTRARKPARRTRQTGTPERRMVTKQIVRLPEMFTGVNTTAGPDVLENVNFVDCTIIGPGVLAFGKDVEMKGVTFEHPDVFIPLEPDRYYFGVIGVRNCGFYTCRFERVGIAGPRPMIDSALKEMDPGIST